MLQGGEVTGSLDESIRHAITKLAHLHFVSTDEARRFSKLLDKVEGSLSRFQVHKVTRSHKVTQGHTRSHKVTRALTAPIDYAAHP